MRAPFNIIDRLFAREILLGLVAVIGVLLLIIMGNRLVSYMGMAAAGRIPGDIVVSLLGINLLQNLGLLLAPALFLSVLVTLGRMNRDNEAVALSASGVGLTSFYRGIFLAAVPVALLASLFAFFLSPWAEQTEKSVRRSAEQEAKVNLFSPGVFTERGSGGLVVYVEDATSTGGLKNVFAWGKDSAAAGLVTAKSGRQETDSRTGDRHLVLENGYRYQGTPGSEDYRMLEFEKYTMLLSPKAKRSSVNWDEVPTAELWNHTEGAASAELHWRIGVPVSVLVLALLALPLSRSSPRTARFGPVILAILIYFFYSNMLAVAQSWVERGVVPGWVALNIIHLFVVALVVVILVQQLGLGWVLRGRIKINGS